MEIDLPLRPDSLIRKAPEGVDRDIPVDLNGAISTMKESQRERRVGWHDDENETAAWVEYRLGGELVHRSAHVHLKKASVTGEPAVAAVG